MKKFYLLTKTLLVAVLLCVGASNVWATATTYDFEDGNVRFTAYNSSKITVNIQDGSGPDSDSKAVKFAYKNKGNHNFAYLDFSSLVEDASTVNVSFDFYVTAASGHDLISLADADYHTGANAGFDSGSNTGYGINGAIFNLGCFRAGGANDFAINSSKVTALTSTCLGNWCHADITVDNVGKTVSYTITRCDETVLDAAASATGVSFLNSSAFKCTQIDVYMGATSSGTPIYIDNLVITPTVIATNHSYVIKAVSGGTTLKTFTAGMAAEGATYSYSVPKAVNYEGSYYVLNDKSLSNFNASYTMSTANVTNEITYTLDETIAAFIEGEDCGGTNDNNVEYSSGKYCNMMSKKTKEISIANAGKYCVEAYITGRASNGEFKVYDSDGTTELANLVRNGATGTRTTGSFWRNASSSVKVGYKDGNSMSFDYIIIRKTDKDVTDAIADCKTHETSAAFATYIDGVYAAGSLTTAAEVYAAHTAWQVAQAKASHSTDYSKVILDYAVTTSAANHFWGNLSDGSSAPYDGAPDNYYLTWGPSAEYSVWNGVYGLPAGQYTVTTYTYSSIAGNRNQYIATLDPWVDINTAAKGGSREVINTEGWALTTSTFVLNETDNLAFGFYAENITDRTAGIDNWTLTLTGEQVTVSDAGYATYVSSYDLDFTSTSIKAYTATVNTTTGVVTLNPVNQVPAGTPVVLYKDGGATEFIPVMTGAESVGDNDLVAGEDAAVATGTSPYNYVLDDVDGIGFYKANDVTVASNRAYLQTTYNVAAASGARGMRMVFAGDITGINEAEASAEAAQKEGKFIENGKLVIVKNGKKFNANGTEIK